jgi:hypothetical protein
VSRRSAIPRRRPRRTRSTASSEVAEFV